MRHTKSTKLLWVLSLALVGEKNKAEWISEERADTESGQFFLTLD